MQYEAIIGFYTIFKRVFYIINSISSIMILFLLPIYLIENSNLIQNI